MTDEATQGRKRRAWPFVPAIAICLFVGFWGWAYQGYTEDAGSDAIQSWPIGVGAFCIAGVLSLVAIRRTRPAMTRHQLVALAICLIAFLALAALGSIDAGNP